MIKLPIIAPLFVMLITIVSCGGTDTVEQASVAQNPPSAAAIESPDSVTTPENIMVVVDEVQTALTTGDPSVVSIGRDLEEAILGTIENNRSLNKEALIEIFNLAEDGTPKGNGSSLTRINWNPTHDAALLESTFGENTALLTTNSVFAEGYTARPETLAVLGESTARYIIMGSNPLRNYRRDATALNEEMHQVLENSFAWLTNRSNLKTTAFNVTLAHLADNYYFPDELAIREWIDERFPGQANYNEQDVCDGSGLTACLTDVTDLLIISQFPDDSAGEEQLVAETVQSAMRKGIPVFYLHYDGGLSPLGKALLPLFDVSFKHDNYWQRLSLTAYNPSDYLDELPVDIAATRTMVENFYNNSFAINWDECDGENCDASVSLAASFSDGAKYVQEKMAKLDASKTDLFAVPDKYRLDKLLALLGDHYRMNSAAFPLDKKQTPELDFMRTLFADHAQYQYRDKVGVWSDLGNFSRTDFSHVTPGSRIVNHISKKNFRSTGAYALPGQTVTVTRHDNSAVNVSVFVNTLRTGSTHTFAEFGYKRPRFSQGTGMPIAPGETIRFTSAIGGPIQLGYDMPDLPVEVTFDNIGEHAYWKDSSDNNSFNAKLTADEFDWAEIAAPSFEVHSTRVKMIESMQDPALGDSDGTAQALVNATMRYIHNYPHLLAGYKGSGIDVVDEIHQFAIDNNLDIAELEGVKHMNADQASCGYGCSGNPYDAYWSFSPVGHGDIHELGHGLERSRFRFSGLPGHATTNFYSYYSKTQFGKESGLDPDCQDLPFESTFDVLQASYTQADPAAYIQANLWSTDSWSVGAHAIIQMMMGAEDNGALIDGWHLLARLHIIEREYQKATATDSAWLAKRNGLGMSQYERQNAKDMSNEDWLLIAVSHATGFDHRAYFDVWGHQYSVSAAAQVAAMSLPVLTPSFYLSTPGGYCSGQGFDGLKVALDGVVRLWPLAD